MKCKYCGAEMDENIRQCPNCGKDVLYGTYVEDDEWQCALDGLHASNFTVTPDKLKWAVDELRKLEIVKPGTILLWKLLGFIATILQIFVMVLCFLGGSENRGWIFWIAFGLGCIAALTQCVQFFSKVRGINKDDIQLMKFAFGCQIVFSAVMLFVVGPNI